MRALILISFCFVLSIVRLGGIQLLPTPLNSAAFSAVVSESLLQKSYLAGKDICKTGETGASMLKTAGNLPNAAVFP